MSRASAVREVHYVMGTLLDISAWGPPHAVRAAIRHAARLARRSERLCSVHDPRSALARMNRGDLAATPPRALSRLLRRARAWRAHTGGAFDPEVGGRLDLGGIAKGYAVDGMIRAFRRAGIRRALINFGQSSLYALGAPHTLPGWPVLLRGHLPGTFAGRLILRDAGLSVSGTRRVHLSGRDGVVHVLDPASGRRIHRHAVAAVMGPSAEAAEALSTALLVRGAGAGPLFAARRRYRALYLDAGGSIGFNRFPLRPAGPRRRSL